eukprot:gene10936-biopygen7805
MHRCVRNCSRCSQWFLFALFGVRCVRCSQKGIKCVAGSQCSLYAMLAVRRGSLFAVPAVAFAMRSPHPRIAFHSGVLWGPCSRSERVERWGPDDVPRRRVPERVGRGGAVLVVHRNRPRRRTECVGAAPRPRRAVQRGCGAARARRPAPGGMARAGDRAAA